MRAAQDPGAEERGPRIGGPGACEFGGPPSLGFFWGEARGGERRRGPQSGPAGAGWAITPLNFFWGP